LAALRVFCGLFSGFLGFLGAVWFLLRVVL
jgi:hypothetical protein